MRVVDVTQWYAPRSGGIRTYLRAKAAWAARHGREHDAVVTAGRPGLEVVAGSRFAAVRGRTPSERWGYRVAARPAAVIRALDRLEPAVVVIHDALAFPRAIARWAAGRRVAVVMVCHSDLALGALAAPRGLRAPATMALRLAQRRALTVPAAVLVASEESRARIGAHVGVPLVTSPLGVDLDVFAGARPDPRLRAGLAPEGAGLLLYAGRLSGEKRVDLLPAALAALGPGHVLAVAGSGPAERSLLRAARGLGVADRLVMLGHVAGRERLATLMASADCFVHPNPSEPFGLAPLEAVAAGCRVVAADAAGSAEVLGPLGAVLVTAGDPLALADGVRRALAGPRPRADLTGLSWDRTFAREWGVYEALAGGAA